MDVTQPVAGNVYDGEQPGQDISYSSATATKQCSWNDFEDMESNITGYSVTLFINGKMARNFNAGTSNIFSDHSITMHHGDEVEFLVTARNGAGSTTDVRSDGFIVDHTPPVMELNYASHSGQKYQTSTTELNLQWMFVDEESGIKEYRYAVYETIHGVKSQFWPMNSTYATKTPSAQGTKETVVVDSISLSTGGQYSVHVTAINNAGMSTDHETESVMVDDTQPVVTFVSVHSR